MAINRGEEEVTTAKGNFRYQGNSSFASSAISLLMALKVSGVKLTELDGYGGGGIFVERGTVVFKVEGTSHAVDLFINVYDR